MSYTFSVKFKSEDEVFSMLEFLKTEEANKILDKIKAVNVKYEQPVNLWFEQGGENAPYLPRYNPELMIYNNGSLHHDFYCKVQLFTWMAVKSKHRNKNNNPVVFYDDEAMELICIDDMSINESKKLVGTKIKNGQYYKDFPSDLLSIVAKWISKKEKMYKATLELMIELDKAYLNYQNKPTNDKAGTKKKKVKP